MNNKDRYIFRLRPISDFTDEQVVEVRVTANPTQVPHDKIQTIDEMFVGKDCWIDVGYVQWIYGAWKYVIYGKFFHDSQPVSGTTLTRAEAVEKIFSEEVMEALKNVKAISNHDG